MAIFRTKSAPEAARFVRSLMERGYRRSGGNRAVGRGCYRIGAPRRGWLRVIFTEIEDAPRCSSPGHESRLARARGLCDLCWRRWKYANDPEWREKRLAESMARYRSLTKEEREIRRRKQRAAGKLRRWARKEAA